MNKIKIFHDYNYDTIEKNVNDFIKDKEVISINYMVRTQCHVLVHYIDSL